MKNKFNISTAAAEMDIDLIPYIECLDHTPNSDRLLDSIYLIIRNRIENPIYNQEVCDTVFLMYYRLRKNDGLSESYVWWDKNFLLYKDIKYSIECRLIEPDLTEIERMSNLHLIDSILFYVKLMCLQLRLCRHSHVDAPVEAS